LRYIQRDLRLFIRYAFNIHYSLVVWLLCTALCSCSTDIIKGSRVCASNWLKNTLFYRCMRTTNTVRLQHLMSIR